MKKDYSGSIFNRLTAIKYIKDQNKRSIWQFKCSCGSILERSISAVSNGSPKDCGCSRV